MQRRKIKVLHIIGNLNYAGAQEVVHTVVKYLPREECTPIVCTFKDGPLRRDIEALGVKVEILEPRHYKFVAMPRFVADMRRIRRQITQVVREHNIDVIQTHLLGVLNFLILTISFDVRVGITLWTIHNIDFLPSNSDWLLKYKRLGHRLLYRMASRRVGGFIAVSDEVRESTLRQLGPINDKVITISNGVDCQRFELAGNKAELCRELNLDLNACLIVVVGRLHVQKGHCYLIDAATTIIDQFPQVHLLFIGEGELKQTLQEQVQKLGLTENICFLGTRGDIPAILAAVDLFVLPSLWEGLSIALLEAMAAGKPIVATAVSGTNQVMITDQTGLLVPPGDSQALAEAIIQVLSDPMHAQTMGAAARQHVKENFSAQKQANEHLALYHHLLQKR